MGEMYHIQMLMLEGQCSKHIYISYFSALSDNTAFPHFALHVLIFFFILLLMSLPPKYINVLL